MIFVLSVLLSALMNSNWSNLDFRANCVTQTYSLSFKSDSWFEMFGNSIISHVIFLERLLVENKVERYLLWSTMKEWWRICWINTCKHWSYSWLMSGFSIKILIFSLWRLNINLDYDMDTTLVSFIFRVNLMKQSWLMVDEKEVVLFISAEIGLDVVCNKLSLNWFVMIIVSLKN